MTISFMEKKEHQDLFLERIIGEKIVEIYFLVKERRKIPSNSEEEKYLYDLIENFKKDLKLRI